MKPRLALTLATITSVALALAGAAVAVSPALGASGVSTGRAADIPQCAATDLYVARGRVDAGAGNRFLPIRVTNVGDTLCTLPTTTKVRFRDFDGALGFASVPPSPTASLSMQPCARVSTVVHWTDPGPVPAGQCHAADATLVTLRLPALGHTWRLPLEASVCTTSTFRPDASALAR
jgi:Protein of unknown function (DUF4232)